MEVVREITEWNVDFKQPNHDYLLDGDRILAYRKWGEGPVIKLSGNQKLDRRYRKFIKLENHPFKMEKNVDPNVVEVKGSNGNVYYVNKELGTCTCSGFKFRGQCKHLN